KRSPKKSENGSAGHSCPRQYRSARPWRTRASEPRSAIDAGRARVLATCILMAVAFSTPTVQSADWPQWRGPDGTGVSSEKGLPIVWHEQRSIVWKCPLPEWGTSTPIVASDAVLLTTHTADDKLLLLKIDKRNGQILWTQEIGSGTS